MIAHLCAGLIAHLRAQNGGQFLEQLFCTRHLARQAIAHAHRQRRGRLAPLFDNVKVMVKAGHLVDAGLRQLHLLGQRRQVRTREVPITILKFVQVLNEQIALARAAAQQQLHLRQRLGLNAPPFGGLTFSFAQLLLPLSLSMHGNRNHLFAKALLVRAIV